MSYETFAFVYDEVMDASLYQDWLAFSRRHLPTETKRILELACGTGALACEFAREGYDVTALDLSEEMLMMASERAEEEDVHIQLVKGDMRDLSEVGTYEAITCFSDSLCYMPDRQAVQQVFDTVYNALEPNGCFIFDVHSTFQVASVFPNIATIIKQKSLLFMG